MDCILHVNLIFIHKMDHVVGRGEDLAPVQKISFQGGEIQDVGLLLMHIQNVFISEAIQ